MEEEGEKKFGEEISRILVNFPLDIIKIILGYSLVVTEYYHTTVDTNNTSDKYIHDPNLRSLLTPKYALRGNYKIRQMVCSETKLYYIHDGNISKVFVLDLKTFRQVDYFEYYFAQLSLLVKSVSDKKVFIYITTHLYDQSDYSKPAKSSAEIYNLETKQLVSRFSILEYTKPFNKRVSIDENVLYIYDSILKQTQVYNLETQKFVRSIPSSAEMLYVINKKFYWLGRLPLKSKIRVIDANNLELSTGIVNIEIYENEYYLLTENVLTLQVWTFEQNRNDFDFVRPIFSSDKLLRLGPCVAINHRYVFVTCQHKIFILGKKKTMGEDPWCKIDV